MSRDVAKFWAYAHQKVRKEEIQEQEETKERQKEAKKEKQKKKEWCVNCLMLPPPPPPPQFNKFLPDQWFCDVSVVFYWITLEDRLSE